MFAAAKELAEEWVIRFWPENIVPSAFPMWPVKITSRER
jgi:hypothetical protein